MKIRAYTDGACSNHEKGEGPGGWGVIISDDCGITKLSGNSLGTTNNQMELFAVISSLVHFNNEYQENKIKRGDEIEIISDSAYVVNAINQGWLTRWKLNGWKTTTGTNVKNKELWEQLNLALDYAYKAGLIIKLIKVKGHAGNALNEMADDLARGQSEKAQLELGQWEEVIND